MELKNLIKIDLEALPNSECIKLGEEINSTGNMFSDFRLLIDKKEMGIFDTLLIRVFAGKNKNFIFSTLDKPSIILNRIKLLVNDLYKIHGQDISGKETFTDYDESCLAGEEFWVGRNFTYHQIYKPLTRLSYDSANGLRLTIWNP